MDLSTIAAVIAGATGLGIIVWVLAKLGRALIKIAEALAAAAAVFLALWLVIKAVGWALRQTITHWRTSLTVVALAAWWQWWGWPSLALTAGVAIGGHCQLMWNGLSSDAANWCGGVLGLLVFVGPACVGGGRLGLPVFAV